MRRGLCLLWMLLAWGMTAFGQSPFPAAGVSLPLAGYAATGGTLPDAPGSAVVVGGGRGGVRTEYQTNIRRFSRLAVGVNVGIDGIGVEAATPLSNKWNLRAGGSFLAGSYTFQTSSSAASSSFGATLPDNAIDVIVEPHFKSGMVTADWFPWYGSFRVSPGLTVYNGNRATIQAAVRGGETIGVGDGTYTSDPNDPIRAVLGAQLGSVLAPRLTVGWGNMIPREGRRFSFPFEIGVEYAGRPEITLRLTGSECDPDGSCHPLSVDPTTQANIAQEQKQLNGDIAPLRFYPVVSSGVSYRF